MLLKRSFFNLKRTGQKKGGPKPFSLIIKLPVSYKKRRSPNQSVLVGGLFKKNCTIIRSCSANDLIDDNSKVNAKAKGLHRYFLKRIISSYHHALGKGIVYFKI